MQARVRWGIVSGEFHRMPAALVVGDEASRRAELFNQISAGNGQELRIGHSAVVPNIRASLGQELTAISSR
jgi:hypothetical protein